MKEGVDTFQGFIRVYMNLMRPISMSLSPRPTSIYDVVGEDSLSSDNEDTMTTSFYLPKDTTKVIHIRSDTTAQEVIKALLHKFKITDNPRKFAVYEKIMEPGKKVIKRRLADDEKPLPLCLSWTADGLETRRFILQENETGEVMWEAFSVPELENFLRILDREEEEYLEQVRAKYQLLKIQMTQRMKEMDQEREKSFAKDTRTPVFV
jgi:Ras association domain-containing protein 1